MRGRPRPGRPPDRSIVPGAGCARLRDCSAGNVLQARARSPIFDHHLYSDAGQRQLAALAAATPFITRGFGIAFAIAGLAVAGIWAVQQGKVPLTAALAGLAVLVAVDLGRVDRAFIRTLDFHEWAAPDENIRFLQARRDEGPPFRVADLRGSEQNVDLAMHGLDILVGHHPNDLARYRTLLGLQASVRTGENSRDPKCSES